MRNSKTEAINIQDTPGVFCRARSKEVLKNQKKQMHEWWRYVRKTQELAGSTPNLSSKIKYYWILT